MNIQRFLLPGAVILAFVLSCGNDASGNDASSSTASSPLAPDTEEAPLSLNPEHIPNVKLEKAFPHLTFTKPLFLTHAGDGSDALYVVENGGTIKIFSNDPQTKVADVFLDISSRVYISFIEEGLLALAFHPKFKDNGYFYVYYTRNKPRRGVISRFTASPSSAKAVDPATEKVILKVRQPYVNHNGCCLLFGPDGYLYASFGDGGDGGDPHDHGQNLSTLLGSIVRIDVDKEENGKPYAIPPDNPFVGRQDARPEIWAYGLRNVWRMSFDSVTHALWAADVGQDRWEEIDLIVKGGNYGWNRREGAHPYHGRHARKAVEGELFVEPIAEYSHQKGLSITGGYVYRGKRYPDMQGVYFYADYVSTLLWGLRHENGATLAHRELVRTGVPVTSFGVDADGELFITAYDGHIYRVVATE